MLDQDIHQDGVRAEVLGPSGPLHFDFDFVPAAGGGKVMRGEQVHL